MKRRIIKKIVVGEERELLIRNHLLCPYINCEANKRSGNLRIQVIINKKNETREVRLKKTVRGKRGKTKLPYKYTAETFSGLSCPYCSRPLEVVVDETHDTRYVYLRRLK